eukprot:3874789-Rhodomonas_salina.4
MSNGIVLRIGSYYHVHLPTHSRGALEQRRSPCRQRSSTPQVCPGCSILVAQIQGRHRIGKCSTLFVQALPHDLVGDLVASYAQVSTSLGAMVRPSQYHLLQYDTPKSVRRVSAYDAQDGTVFAISYA